MKRIAIVGCGGINSWFIHSLHDVLKVFEKRDLVYVKLFDNDEVEEKNLLRGNQNFTAEDLMEQKAEVLAKKYGFDYENILITKETIEQLSGFDDVILGVDNHKTRLLLYEYCHSHKKYLLDMRAQGTQIAYYILDCKKPFDYYMEKHFSNEDVMSRKGSCQLARDVEKDHIENGNKIIAYLCAYGVYLKHLRGEEAETDEYKAVY